MKISVSDVCYLYVLRVFRCVFCSIPFLFAYNGCVCDFNSKVHCGSALGPGASGLPYYCAPRVCIPAVLEGLAVWRHNKPKTGKTVRCDPPCKVPPC